MDNNAFTWDIIKPFLAGQLRHALTVASGALIAKGALQADQQGAFIQIGLGMTSWAAVAVWSWWQKDGQALIAAELAKLKGHVQAIPTPPAETPNSVSAAIAAAKTVAGCLVLFAAVSMLCSHADAQTVKPKIVQTQAKKLPVKSHPVQHAAPKVTAQQPVVSATAKPKQIPLRDAQANPLTALQAFTVGDLQAALADANAQMPPDKTAAACYSALIPLVQTGITNPFPAGLGGFQALQKARDAAAALSSLQSPTGVLADLNIACAPLVLSVQNTLIQLGIVGGGIAASGGLTLPISLPALFPLLGGL